MLGVSVFACVSLLIIGAFGGDDRDKMEVALLTLGIVTILLIIMRTENAIAVTMSILIVGTVVTGDRFLLSAVSLVQDTNEEGRRFVENMYGDEATRPVEPANVENIARRVVELIDSQHNPDKAQRIIENVITDVRLEEIVIQVGSASTPLRRLSTGGSSWTRFVDDFKNEEFFQEDMRNLRRLNLATFDNAEFKNAKITNTGKRVLELLDESPLERAIQRSTLPPGPTLPNVDIESLPEVEIGSEHEIEFQEIFNSWKKIEVKSRANLTIFTEGDTDTIIHIYDIGKNLIAYDDDGGDFLNAKIEHDFAAGTYLVRIEHFDKVKGRSKIVIRLADSAPQNTTSTGN